MSGLSWNGHNVFGDRSSIAAVRQAINAETTVAHLRDEVMRREVRIKVLEQRVSDMSWTPGSYQNGA
jgi:hypothetical protein